MINCTPGIRCTAGRSLFFSIGVFSAWIGYTGDTTYPEFYRFISFFYIPAGIAILLFVKTYTVDPITRTLTVKYTIIGKTKTYQLDEVKSIQILPLRKNLANLFFILPEPGLMHIKFSDKICVSISRNETNRGYEELKEYFHRAYPDQIDSYE